jgi:ADP-heptose:LPS heptosyltransferase
MLPPLLLSVRVPTLLARFWRARFGEKFSSEATHRGRLSIIIFRLDAMGDVVMTTPLFRELKRAFPKSLCTVVVQHGFRPLLVTNPHIDEILTPPKVGATWLPRRARELVAAMLLYWRCLRRRRFDIAISPRWDLDEQLATLLCLLTNAAKRVGYTEKTSPLKQQLNRGFDAAFSTCLPAGPVRHEVVRNLAVVEAFGATVRDGRLEVPLTGRDRDFASRLLTNVPASSKMIALGIGANSAGRRWPLQRYAECVSRVARKVRVQPVIVCSASERAQARQLAELLTCEPIILSGAPLRGVCAVLERCDIFIGNDSGTAHLAAAMNCKTIVISRHPRDGDPNHGNSPLRFAPHCTEALVLQPATGLDACRASCRVRGPHCITAVSVDEVVAAARKMLGREPARFHPDSAHAATLAHGHRELPLAVIARTPAGVPMGRTVQGKI